MIVVLAIDALEYEYVNRFNCKNLMQTSYGKTDISEFTEPRTMVLWGSFMTGKNKEKEILAKGGKEMWNTRFNTKDTFFSRFKNPCIIDLPGFSYDLEVHKKSRSLLKKFFEAKTGEEKEKIKEEYNKDAFDHHKKVKKEFIAALDKKHDFVLGYFSLVDVIGHLNFGNNIMMGIIYREMDDLARFLNEKIKGKVFVISDHGMKPIGVFGDHSEYGFWSLNTKINLKNPKITAFAKII